MGGKPRKRPESISTEGPTFRIGQKVKKVFHGLGDYTEEAEGVVTAIEDGVVYVNNESGITFDLRGQERERFFLPMRAEIIPSGEE